MSCRVMLLAACSRLCLCEAFFLLLVSYVGERPWWPKQSLDNGRKKKGEGFRGKSDQILDLKDGKL